LDSEAEGLWEADSLAADGEALALGLKDALAEAEPEAEGLKLLDSEAEGL